MSIPNQRDELFQETKNGIKQLYVNLKNQMVISISNKTITFVLKTFHGLLLKH